MAGGTRKEQLYSTASMTNIKSSLKIVLYEIILGRIFDTMTRGKIVFTDEKGRYYQTLEFNGDMYPSGHGETIIEKYEDGGIRSYDDYERFAVSFDRRYFGDADSADELISEFMLENDSVDYTNNWTDYLYVINGSGRVVRAFTKEGTVEIPAAEMAVFHYQNFDRMVQIKRDHDSGF